MQTGNNGGQARQTVSQISDGQWWWVGGYKSGNCSRLYLTIMTLYSALCVKSIIGGWESANECQYSLILISIRSAFDVLALPMRE